MIARKSYRLLICLAVFVFGCLLSEKGSNDKVLRCDVSLNSGKIISFIQANNHGNSFKTDKTNNKHSLTLLISESRTSITDDNNFSYSDNAEITVKTTSTALSSYIKNYDCNRVLHPPLSKLKVLLI